MVVEYAIWRSLTEMTVFTGRAVPDTSLWMEERSKWFIGSKGSEATVMRGARIRTAAVPCVVSGVYFVYQYPLRSTPPVMMPQLSEPFGLSAFAIVSMLDPFYCGRSPFTLVAGAAVDRLGLRTVLPIAAAASLLANTGQCGVSARSEGADHPDQPSQ
jgi:hypothetical protein